VPSQFVIVYLHTLAGLVLALNN